jgi:glucosamine--fructose-6-phosphate aminotransferase (isomerizing)
MEDNEIARVTGEGFRTTTLDAVPVTKDIEEVEWTLDQIELGGHEYFMLKEIFEQPTCCRHCMRGRDRSARRSRSTWVASRIARASWCVPGG